MRVPRLTTWCGLAALAVLCATVGISVGCSGPADQGRELEQAGDLEGAILYYEAALREDPDDVELLAALASDLALLGRHDQALPVQERVVELDQEDVQTRLELGFNYLNHQKDRAADAVRILSEAALLEPTAQHLTFKAQAQILLGDDEGADRGEPDEPGGDLEAGEDDRGHGLAAHHRRAEVRGHRPTRRHPPRPLPTMFRDRRDPLENGR